MSVNNSETDKNVNEFNKIESMRGKVLSSDDKHIYIERPSLKQSAFQALI